MTDSSGSGFERSADFNDDLSEEAGQRALHNLAVWRERFQKLHSEGKSEGTVVWVRVLSALLDDPKACEAWLRLHGDRARQEELTRLAERILRIEIDERSRHR